MTVPPSVLVGPLVGISCREEAAGWGWTLGPVGNQQGGAEGLGSPSLTTSPITLYLCVTLLFFPLSYCGLTLGEAKDIIYSSLLYQICVKHLIKHCFHTARDVSAGRTESVSCAKALGHSACCRSGGAGLSPAW